MHCYPVYCKQERENRGCYKKGLLPSPDFSFLIPNSCLPFPNPYFLFPICSFLFPNFQFLPVLGNRPPEPRHGLGDGLVGHAEGDPEVPGPAEAAAGHDQNQFFLKGPDEVDVIGVG